MAKKIIKKKFNGLIYQIKINEETSFSRQLDQPPEADGSSSDNPYQSDYNLTNFRLSTRKHKKKVDGSTEVELTKLHYNDDGTAKANQTITYSSGTKPTNWDAGRNIEIEEKYENDYLSKASVPVGILDLTTQIIKSGTEYYHGNNSVIIGEDIGFLPDSADGSSSTLKAAVDAWIDDKTSAEVTYGNIEDWIFPKVTSLDSLFSSSRNIKVKNITDLSGIENWDISNVKGIGRMFFGCEKITSLNLSSWDTSNVESMSSVFTSCYKLETLNLTDWDLTNIKTDTGGISFMFQECVKLSTLTGINNWDVSKVDNMVSTFSKCRSLTSLNLSSWNTKNVKTMEGMFNNAGGNDNGGPAIAKLISVGDISNWDVRKSDSFASMFNSCKKLPTLNLTSWNIKNAYTTNSMFTDCEKLTSIGNISSWKTQRTTFNCAWMFSGCSKLNNIGNLSSWKSNITKVLNLFNMFSGTSKLTSIGDIGGWDITNITNIYGIRDMFKNSGVTNPGNLSRWNVCENKPAYTDFATGAAFNTEANASRLPKFPYNIENCPQP